jgi:hypothetical protein
MTGQRVTPRGYATAADSGHPTPRRRDIEPIVNQLAGMPKLHSVEINAGEAKSLNIARMTFGPA